MVVISDIIAISCTGCKKEVIVYIWSMNRIIAIGGVSRAGKSFLADRLATQLGRDSVRILCQDDFVLPVGQIPMVRDHIDWETPASIDFNRLRQTLAASGAFAWVIVEGLLVFSDPQLFRTYDFTIFIDIPKDLFLTRKATDLRWGAEPDWYIEYIWESFLDHGQFPAGRDPDLRLDGSQDFDVELIADLLKQDQSRGLPRD